MEKISKVIQKNIESLRDTYNDSDELIVKDMLKGKTKLSLVFIAGLVDVELIGKLVVDSIYHYVGEKKITIDSLKDSIIALPQIDICEDILEIKYELSHGKAILFLSGSSKCLVLSVDKFKERSIAEPPTSSVLKGPRAGFVENIKTNVSAIRKILGSNHFVSENLKVGRITKTQVSVIYLDNVADKRIVNDVKKSINGMDIDGVLDSYYLVKYLEQHKHSIFKQIGSAEKPDVIAGKVLEGRVAIVVDGSPIVLTVPFMLIEDLQSAGDYYEHNARATLLRLLRVTSMLITMLLPALYVAVELYHYKAIPLKFLVTIINSTQGLPFTPFVEIMFVLILFEILYEASLRMPTYLGLALSVVGALILGDTAVKAGLISPPAVMIVAVSGITLYTVPEQVSQLSILRILFTLAGGVLGFYGIILVAIYIVIYLCDFDNYGTPYLSPYAPVVFDDAKDALQKVPITEMVKRPKSIPNINPVREVIHQRKNASKGGKDDD